MADVPIALQLYTVRDEAARDFAGTLQRVSELGYHGVEFAGFGGLKARDLRRQLDDLGLEAAGAHIGFDQLESELDEVLEYNETLGNRQLICPTGPTRFRGSADGYRRLGRALDAIGAACREAGFRLAYHNHSFEFERFAGETGLQLILDAAAPEHVGLELDVYWAVHGGFDPVACLRRYSNRGLLVHLKDMADDPDRSFAEVGEGIIDFGPVFAEAERYGVPWYVVEQDRCQRPSLESARISLQNLRHMGKV